MTASNTEIEQSCPMCRGSLEPHTSDVHDANSGEGFSIEYCSGCGVGVTVPAPRRVETYYRERYYGNRHGFTRGLCVWRRRRLVDRHIQAGDSGRLLDVGSGEGDFLHAPAAPDGTPPELKSTTVRTTANTRFFVPSTKPPRAVLTTASPSGTYWSMSPIRRRTSSGSAPC